MNSTQNLYIGVDLGGTSIVAGLFSSSELLEKTELPTGANQSANEIIDTLCAAIKKVITADVCAIGIGMPGYIDVETGTVLLINNIPAFQGVSIKAELEKHFECPVYINNDANCFALGETYFGAGLGFNDLIGITIGTGLGGGVIKARKVHAGLVGGAGEFGCISFKDSNVENYCSSQFFTNKYQKTGLELYNEAKAGNAKAQAAFNELGNNIGELIHTIIYFYSPEAIIIGGSIAKAFELFQPSMLKTLGKFPVALIREKVKIMPSQLDNAGLYGAAALCISQE